jgi:hypothetical protein
MAAGRQQLVTCWSTDLPVTVRFFAHCDELADVQFE